MLNHSLIKTLRSLRGNPRACVYTEPLWGIPFFLFTPFAAVYMSALMVSDQQIGIIASVAMFSRALASFLSGAITDKLGRKRTVFIFDVIAWSIPCLLWAFSQNHWWFIMAALFNGIGEVTHNSWNCLLVEDADKSTLVDIYAWVHISGMLAMFFAPLAGLLVDNLSLIPAVRIIYLFSFVSMSLKFIILNKYCTETEVGKQRLKETKGVSFFSLLLGYGSVARKLFTSPKMVMALIIIACFIITNMVTTTFFGLYATRNLLMDQSFLAYFPIIRAAIILLFFFIIQPKIAKFGLKGPVLIGVFLYITAYLLLITMPARNLPLLLLCIFLESTAHGLVWPRRDSIQVLFIEPQERARLNSILASVISIVAIPFGYLSGWLSGLDGRFPFVLIVAIFVIQFIVVLGSRSLRTKNVRALEAMYSEDAV